MDQRVRDGIRSGQEPSSSSKDARALPVVASWFPQVDACVNPISQLGCRQIQCRYHLEHRDRYDHQRSPTRDCSLVVANEGEHTLEEVAAVLSISEERVRQLEERALEKLRSHPALDLTTTIVGARLEPK